jgi:imidazolonepropionase-like amidohydrolase
MPTIAYSTDVRSRVSAAAVVALTATALIALPSSAPTAARNGAGTVVVSGGTLVDGTGRQALPGATIVVRDGRVAEVTAGSVASLRAGTEGIDAHGKWIVPGLIDVHVHYHPGWMDALFLRHGVTTVRDVGSGLDSILEFREHARVPGVARPRIFACGPLIDGAWPRHGTGISMSVQTVAEARGAARRLLDRGVDCLKIYEQLTPPLVEAVVREAEGTRVPVTAHLRDTTALQALEIGVRGLEHAFGFDACDETIAAQVVRRVIERAAYVVPTLAVTEQVSRLGSPEQETMPLLGDIPAARRQYWRAMATATSPERTAGAARWLGCLKPFVARLQKAGGHVVAGSDTSNPYVVPGASLHRELALLVEAGLSPREALAAATRTAAAFLGQAQTLGTLEVGKTADLVVLGADPVASIAAIHQIELVIRDGRVVWRR